MTTRLTDPSHMQPSAAPMAGSIAVERQVHTTV